jgi:hypothetical protein
VHGRTVAKDREELRTENSRRGVFALLERGLSWIQITKRTADSIPNSIQECSIFALAFSQGGAHLRLLAGQLFDRHLKTETPTPLLAMA